MKKYLFQSASLLGFAIMAVLNFPDFGLAQVTGEDDSLLEKFEEEIQVRRAQTKTRSHTPVGGERLADYNNLKKILGDPQYFKNDTSILDTNIVTYKKVSSDEYPDYVIFHVVTGLDLCKVSTLSDQGWQDSLNKTAQAYAEHERETREQADAEAQVIRVAIEKLDKLKERCLLRRAAQLEQERVAKKNGFTYVPDSLYDCVQAEEEADRQALGNYSGSPFPPTKPQAANASAKVDLFAGLRKTTTVECYPRAKSNEKKSAPDQSEISMEPKREWKFDAELKEGETAVSLGTVR
ncbi:MAG: hypothetical protein IT289_04145 [Oligoflexia bacterium]|nr:hypothetical protein [Oligoflexia bacterium]